MQTITQQEFEESRQRAGGEYYRTRRNYMQKVIDIIQAEGIESALELGPGPLPVMRDSHLMLNPTDDVPGRPLDHAPKEYVHDATDFPWPVGDKQYDLFVALQVWEHLGTQQAAAFREVIRVARMAILSFPLMWDFPEHSHNYPAHHMINEDKIAEWTLGLQPERVAKTPRFDLTIGKENGWRAIYFWRFR